MTSKSEAIIPLVYLLFLSLAEMIHLRGESRLGFVVYALILLSLLLQASLAKRDEINHFCLALTLIPLGRLVAYALPLNRFDPLAQVAAFTVPLLVTTFLVIHYLPLRIEALRLGAAKSSRWPAYVFGSLFGILFGLLIGQIVPSPLLIARETSLQIVVVVVVLAALGALLEELIFRGILLHSSQVLLGQWSALLYVSFLYGLLHLGSNSWVYVGLAITFSLGFGWLVFKTRSFYPAVLAHIWLNITLLLLPLFGWVSNPPRNTVLMGMYSMPGVGEELWQATNRLSIVALVILLIVKELAINADGRWRLLARYLNIVIAPLLLTFLVLLAVGIVDLLP